MRSGKFPWQRLRPNRSTPGNSKCFVHFFFPLSQFLPILSGLMWLIGFQALLTLQAKDPRLIEFEARYNRFSLCEPEICFALPLYGSLRLVTENGDVVLDDLLSTPTTSIRMLPVRKRPLPHLCFNRLQLTIGD